MALDSVKSSVRTGGCGLRALDVLTLVALSTLSLEMEEEIPGSGLDNKPSPLK
jgi:hypothetical protein